jgi:chromosome partitioning protein
LWWEPDGRQAHDYDRDRQSEGRGGQDHHRDQHRHGDGGDRVEDAAARPRSARQRLDRTRPAERPSRPDQLRSADRGPAIPHLDLLPATVDLSGAELELVGEGDRANRLRDALANHHAHDVCFIDCPPSLGLLTLNALTAADTLLIPLQCEFFALEGLSQLLQTVERVQGRFNADLGIVGVVLTMFDRRNRLTDQVAEDVRECLGNLVFDSVIPRNVRLSEAPSHGLPALVYDHSCAGSRAYMALARELIRRLPQERKAA